MTDDERPLPPGFEDRVVDELRRRGLVRVRPEAPGARRLLLRLAAAAGLFGAGLGAGRLSARSSEAPAGRLFLLLLYPGPRFVSGGSAEEAGRVAEYGAWAGALRSAGQLEGAARLRGLPRVLGADGAVPAGPVPQGYFLIRARDASEADAIAHGCPHLRHGGRVAVHDVDG